jgi:Antitoxin SocA-like, Panacea domain
MTDHRRLEDTITYLLEKTRLPLTRTALVKLLYFTDLRNYEQRGQPITGLRWIWYNFGPFSSEIYDALGDLESADEVTTEVHRNYYGSPEYRIHLGPAAGYYQVLEESEQAIIDDVVTEFSGIHAQRLAEFSYYTAPMRDPRLKRGAALDFSAYREALPRPVPYALDPSVPRPERMTRD